MPGFLLSKLKQAQPSMRRRLFLYMGALALLLLAVLFVALLLLGQLKSPRAETEKAPGLPPCERGVQARSLFCVYGKRVRRSFCRR